MAAPTVGAVMADILPYLGVQQVFSQEDAAGKTVVLDDYTGMSAEDVKKKLKTLSLTARIVGTGDTVTGQIPRGGQAVPGNSEILIYLGEPVPTETVEVPDFTGMNRQQARAAAGELGLYILVVGNQEISTTVTVTAQDISPKTQVPVGSTVRLTFADTKAPD
jgi:stage V sporulation protein D (sporulation-specific penicillin-binding protein)